jgi:hypothetical protein
MTTISDRIRALHEAEPELHRAELARRIGTNRQLVNQALRAITSAIKTGCTPAPPAPHAIRKMDGAELDACMRKIGVSAPWLAQWLGLHERRVYARINNETAVQPAEAALFRLLASGEISLERVVSLSAASPEPPDGDDA